MSPIAKAVLDVPSDIRKFSTSKFEQRPVFVFVYMRGCPWCDMMKPEWERFKRANVVNTIDVNHVLLDQLKLLSPPCRSLRPNGYPHIQLIKPNSVRDLTYDGSYPRDQEHFIKFVRKHVVEPVVSSSRKSPSPTKTKPPEKTKKPTEKRKKDAKKPASATTKKRATATPKKVAASSSKKK